MELLLLLGHTANATITPEPQQAALETQDFGTSWCIQAAGTKLPQTQLKQLKQAATNTIKGLGEPLFPVPPSCCRQMTAGLLLGGAAHAHVWHRELV